MCPKYLWAHPSLMASGSVIFALQADKAGTSQNAKGRDRLQVQISPYRRNVDSIENTGHCLEFAATRRTYEAVPAVPPPFPGLCLAKKKKQKPIKVKQWIKKGETTPFIHSALFVTRSNQFLRIQSAFQLFSACCTFKCVLPRCIFDNCACALGEEINSRSKTIIQVMLRSILNVLMLDAKDRHWQKKTKKY